MKKFLLIILAAVLPFTAMAKKKETQNIMVWGVVETAADGLDYLTMFKNCPAKVTAQFHFLYKDGSSSEMYDLIMPDTVSQVKDPVPVDKPVNEVAIDKVIYSTVQKDGQEYTTQDPDDPILVYLLADMFDLYSELFWFDVTHRAYYYERTHGSKWAPNTARYANTHSSTINKGDIVSLDKLSSSELLIGVAAVSVASAGMIFAIADQWNVPDDRFPYVSFAQITEFFLDSGTMRNVVQFKWRTGNRGGMSFLSEVGHTTGSLFEDYLFDSGFTWSVGLGLDLGAFSLQFKGKPAIKRYGENFLSCKANYDIFAGKHFAIGLGAGVALINHDNQLYADYPLSLGFQWSF